MPRRSRSTRLYLLPAAMLLGLAGTALGQTGQMVDATLSTGETIRATLVSDDGTTMVFNHPLLGTLTLPKASVAQIAPTPPPPPPPHLRRRSPRPRRLPRSRRTPSRSGKAGTPSSSSA
jgi:hypothetical protein